MKSKRILTLLLCLCFVLSTVGCGKTELKSEKEVVTKVESQDTDLNNEDKDNGVKVKENSDEPFDGLVSKFNLSNAEDSVNNEIFKDLEPLYNVPEDKQFVIDLNLSKEEALPSFVERGFRVYLDRECTEELIVDVKYDYKTNKVIIRPDKESWKMYPREGIDTKETRTWGGLSTYYLVIDIDVNSKEIVHLEKPTRMMFTIKSEVDIPTVVARPAEDGNITLYWKAISGATDYKVYYGSPYAMKELGVTKNTEFTLTESKYALSSMNTLLSGTYDYAVVAIKDGKESRLSNIIYGEDYEEIAPETFPTYEKLSYDSDDIDSLFDLPTTVELRMKKYLGEEGRAWLTKEYYVIWDLRNILESESGVQYFAGKIPGTTFTLRYLPSLTDMPTEEEIYEFEQNRGLLLPKSGASDVSVSIDIPNNPSIKDVSEDKEQETNITDLVSKKEVQVVEKEKNLELAIAKGLLNFEEEINLSSYPESGDSVYLKDVLQKVITQYPLIIGETTMEFDFASKTLYPQFSISKEEGVKQQKEIIAKVKEVVKKETSSNMSVLEKQIALHDWLINNVEYHTQILDSYMSGENLNDIAYTYADSFNPYGALIKGIGVCQSYSEAYKLLCDEAGIPCIIVTGTMQTVPHSWNKVNINGIWYNVDVTNNDGEEGKMIPYAVFNSSNVMISNDYVENNTYALDNEIKSLYSKENKEDYYFINNKLAESEEQLATILEKEIAKGEMFFVKIVPEINDDSVRNILIDALSGTNYTVRYARILNVLIVVYK